MNTLIEKWKSAPESVQRIYAQEGLIVTVGQAIREILESQGVTQTVLAKRLGKSEGHVSRLLNGRNLTLRTIADIGFALGVEVRARFVESRGFLEIVSSNINIHPDARAANGNIYVGQRLALALTPSFAPSSIPTLKSVA